MSTELIQINWKEFNTSKRWFKRLKKNNDDKEIPLKTLEAMETWFPPFLAFHNCTPDELIEEALTDPENAEDRLDDFYNKRKKEIDRNSCITGIYGVIKGFYRHNKVNVLDISAPSFSERLVVKTDSNYPVFKIVEVSKGDTKIKKLVLNRDLLREFYSHLSNTYQCVFLCLLSTGLDSQDLLKITVGDVRSQLHQERIHFSGNRNKTYSSFASFATKEASHRIKVLVKTQRENAEDDEPVFVISTQSQKCAFFKIHGRRWVKGDELPIPMKITAQDISDAFRTAQVAMNIPLQKRKQSPLRPKRFKKVFRTACGNAGLDKDVTKTFLGHQGEQSQNYQEEGRTLLEFYFEMVEPKISLFFDEEADIEDQNKLKLKMIEYEARDLKNDEDMLILKTQMDHLMEERYIPPTLANRMSINEFVQNNNESMFDPTPEEIKMMKEIRQKNKNTTTQ